MVMVSRRGPGNRAERRLTHPLIGYQAEEDAGFDAWAALGLFIAFSGASSIGRRRGGRRACRGRRASRGQCARLRV
jgi:hypothetical protein